MAQTVNQTTDFFLGKILFFLEDCTLLRLQLAKLEQLDCKSFFVGAFAKSGYLILGRENVKNDQVKVTLHPYCPKEPKETSGVF